MPYGLKHIIIDKINAVFINYPQIDKVVLYGSRAKGNYKNGSDIDLAIIGGDIDLALINKVENELDDLYLPYTFDISIFRHIRNENLLDHINRVGVVFYVNLSITTKKFKIK